jgi:CHAT domain-containing protein/tetratricopeptide (TPR) repeat protein
MLRAGLVQKLAVAVIMATLAAVISMAAQAQEPQDISAANKQVEQLYREQKYAEATPIAEQTLAQAERTLGAEHPDTLTSVKNLAELYEDQGRYSEAEPLFKRALEGRERVLGADNADTLVSVNNLGVFYFRRGRYGEAAPLFKRGLEARERVLGPDHVETLESISNLAALYDDQSRYEEAEALYWRAVVASGRALGPDHADTLTSLDDLGAFLHARGRYRDAEPFKRRVLEASERTQGVEDPRTLSRVNKLATLYFVQGRYREAEPLFKRAVEVQTRVLGAEDPATLISANNLAVLYRNQGNYIEAELLMRRNLEVRERVLGAEHQQTLGSLNNLAGLYKVQGRYPEAEPLLWRALDASERTLGKEHRQSLLSLNNMAELYLARRRYAEAEPFYRRATEAFERVLGAEHPDTLSSISNLAGLYAAQGRYIEAEPLFKRALEIRERVLGAEHPDTLASLNNLATLYQSQMRHANAEPLLRRALEASERALGSEHPQTLVNVTNLGTLYFVQNDWSRAAQFFRRSTATVIQRTRRGVLNDVRGQTGKKQSEAEQSSEQFVGLIKAMRRQIPRGGAPDAAASLASFQTAQWALSSEAARTLAQMAARGAKGDPVLVALARERQDLVAEWQTRDGLRNAALGAATDKRNAKAEAENRDRLTVTDARLAEIDKRLAADFPDYAALANPSPLSVGEVQAQLRPDEALVLFLDMSEFGPTPEETFIWVVTKTKLRWVRSDLGTAALTREVQALRCGLDEEEWGTVTTARRCGDLLGLTDMPDASRPLPFSLSKAYALYKALFGQIEDMIAGKRLLIVPSGALTSLPFQVLVTKKPKIGLPKTFEAYRDIAWLGRRTPIAILPAVSSLKALRQHAAVRQPGSDAYAGFGNPLLSGDVASCRLANTPAACPGVGDVRRPISRSVIERATVRGNGGTRNVSANMDQVFANGSTPVALLGQVRGLCPLADTAYEINCVAARFKGRSPLIRLAGEATEANIKALSLSGQLARYRVLHLATHGLLSGDVEKMAQRQGEPALVLTPPDNPADVGDDGLLMASEVATLKLNADWVVLSACNTAAGDQIGAQALSGLARAFFYAGGRALLVSHWPVYSDAAVRLTTNAFAELERHPNEGRAEALQKSMTALMDDRSQADNAHPAVWAPFIVVGEGGGDVSPRRQPRGKKVNIAPAGWRMTKASAGRGGKAPSTKRRK